MRGNGGNTEAAEDAERFGFPEEIVRQISDAQQGGGECEVWSENWPIVEAFAAVLTQWRVLALPRGGTHFLGLDYAGVRAGLDLAGLAIPPELWSGFQQMEAAACDELNRRA